MERNQKKKKGGGLLTQKLRQQITHSFSFVFLTTEEYTTKWSPVMVNGIAMVLFVLWPQGL